MRVWKRWLVAGAVLIVTAAMFKDIIFIACTPMPIQFKGAVDTDKPYHVQISLNGKILQDDYVRFTSQGDSTAHEVYARISTYVVRIYHDNDVFIRQPCLGADRVELTIHDGKRVIHQGWRINSYIIVRKTLTISIQAMQIARTIRPKANYRSERLEANTQL